MREEFDYLNSDVNESYVKQLDARSPVMFEREVNERARLLYNLRYDVNEAVARIRNNIAWEFDHSWNKADPKLLKQVEKIVKAHYKQMKGKRD